MINISNFRCYIIFCSYSLQIVLELLQLNPCHWKSDFCSLIDLLFIVTIIPDLRFSCFPLEMKFIHNLLTKVVIHFSWSEQVHLLIGPLHGLKLRCCGYWFDYTVYGSVVGMVSAIINVCKSLITAKNKV